MARSFRGGILRRPSTTESGSRGGLFQFFGEVIGELKKVTWPSREETTRLTMLVIAISATIGIALALFIQPGHYIKADFVSAVMGDAPTAVVEVAPLEEKSVPERIIGLIPTNRVRSQSVGGSPLRIPARLWPSNDLSGEYSRPHNSISVGAISMCALI